MTITIKEGHSFGAMKVPSTMLLICPMWPIIIMEFRIIMKYCNLLFIDAPNTWANAKPIDKT